MDILAKNFNNRQELEAKIASIFGLTTNPKPDSFIKGTKKELKKLHLAHGKTYWGLLIEETDYKESPKRTNKKVDRGKRHKSKLKKVNIKDSKEA